MRALPRASNLRVLVAVAWSAPSRPVEPHPLREKLLALIRRLPGVRFSKVWQHLKTNRGTAKYHILMLERAKEIRAVREKRLTRLYPAQVDAREQVRFALLWRGRVMEVVRFIIDHPFIGQTELTKELHISRKVLRRYVDLLVEQGFVREDRGPHLRQYVAAPDLVRLVERWDGGEVVGNAEMGPGVQGGEDHL